MNLTELLMERLSDRECSRCGRRLTDPASIEDGIVMAIEHQLKIVSASKALNNSMSHVHYEVLTSDGEYSVKEYGSVKVTCEDFVSFDKVTEKLAIKWVKEAIGDLPNIKSNPKRLNLSKKAEKPIGNRNSFGENISSKPYNFLIKGSIINVNL